ncbi:MAG: hypothetical protein IPM52_03705 [Bacteroidetes bacterium]|nr:hypothetical protein [Bacteroidota bacterium]
MFAFLGASAALHAHIEPPKSPDERKNALATREKYRKAGVMRATLTQTSADGKTFPLIEWKYDDQGRESTMVMYDQKTGNKTFVTQTYDRMSNLVLNADRNETGQISEMNVLEYTPENLISRVISYDSNLHISGTMEYTYLKNTVLATKYLHNHSQQYTITYVYVNGKNTGAIQQDGAGKLMMRTVNQYGYDGMRTLKEVYNSDNQLDFYYTYSYSANGDFERIEKRSPERKLLRTDAFTYNEKGLIDTLTISDADGNMILKRQYAYVFIND